MTSTAMCEKVRLSPVRSWLGGVLTDVTALRVQALSSARVRRLTTHTIAWRYQQLIAAGFNHALAVRLAGDAAEDVHRLLTLVDQGCAPHLAARILARSDDPCGTGSDDPY